MSHWMRPFICFNVFSALCLQLRYLLLLLLLLFVFFCWCPSGWVPAWRLHIYLYKFGDKLSPHIFHKKNCCDLNLGDSLCIATLFLFSDSGNYLLNGFHFLFWSILNGVTLKTSNCYFMLLCFFTILRELCWIHTEDGGTAWVCRYVFVKLKHAKSVVFLYKTFLYERIEFQRKWHWCFKLLLTLFLFGKTFFLIAQFRNASRFTSWQRQWPLHVKEQRNLGI